MTKRGILLFDLDGTLLKLGDAENFAYISAFEECYSIGNIDPNWSSYQSRSDVGVAREILDSFFGRACKPEELGCVLRRYVELMRSRVEDPNYRANEVPGALHMLTQAALRAELGLGLATANLKLAAQLRLAKAGMWSLFETGGFGEDGDTKEAILRAAIERCIRKWPRVSREKIILIGDQESDARAAKEASVHFIGVGARFATDPLWHVPRVADYTNLSLFFAEIERFLGHSDF